jgi:uncharacterized protein (DUF302 family)
MNDERDLTMKPVDETSTHGVIEPRQPAGKGKAFGGGVIVGIVVGVVIAGIGVKMLMPSMMLTTHESRYESVEATAEALQVSIENNGWSSPGIRNMNQSMKKQGVTYDRPVRLVEACNAEHAKSVLQTNPEVSTMMPCAFGVYEKDGKVYITGMNMGLMGKMFGGNIAKVMGGAVAEDEKKILETVIKEE